MMRKVWQLAQVQLVSVRGSVQELVLVQVLVQRRH
jgi:hypothetical protein